MKPLLLPCLFFLAIVYSCNHRHEKVSKKTASADIAKKTTHPKEASKKLIPVFGYRFKITGDFDGDGKKEQLTEHFYSKIDHKETNKFYENGDYDTLVALTAKKKPYCFLSCNYKKIADLQIASKDQLLGLSYLKNEGDLDRDGGDEISYVINWADWSNVNTWHIMTYKGGKWEELYSFPVWDWQIPDLPQTYNQYGPMGLQDKIINTENDSANRLIEKNLNDFKGLVKKITNNKIQVIFSNNDKGFVDTTIVNLKKNKKKT